MTMYIIQLHTYVSFKVLVLMIILDWNVMTVGCFGQYSALMIAVGVLILKMAQRSLTPGLIVKEHAYYLTALT